MTKRISALILILAAICTLSCQPRNDKMAAPGFLSTTMDSVVMISAAVDVADEDGKIHVYDWSGSGWAADQKQLPDGSLKIMFRTAGHVLDVVDALESENEDGRVVSGWFTFTYQNGEKLRAPYTEARFEPGDSGYIWVFEDHWRPTLKDGDPSKVRLGDTLYAVGCPLGMGYSVTTGSLAMRISRIEDFLNVPCWLATVMVAHGNSGGPVLNEGGEVVAHVVGVMAGTGWQFSILQPRR